LHSFVFPVQNAEARSPGAAVPNIFGSYWLERGGANAGHAPGGAAPAPDPTVARRLSYLEERPAPLYLHVGEPPPALSVTTAASLIPALTASHLQGIAVPSTAVSQKRLNAI
jgi:hypothetical protein